MPRAPSSASVGAAPPPARLALAPPAAGPPSPSRIERSLKDRSPFRSIFIFPSSDCLFLPSCGGGCEEAFGVEGRRLFCPPSFPPYHTLSLSSLTRTRAPLNLSLFHTKAGAERGKRGGGAGSIPFASSSSFLTHRRANTTPNNGGPPYPARPFQRCVGSLL